MLSTPLVIPDSIVSCCGALEPDLEVVVASFDAGWPLAVVAVLAGDSDVEMVSSPLLHPAMAPTDRPASTPTRTDRTRIGGSLPTCVYRSFIGTWSAKLRVATTRCEPLPTARESVPGGTLPAIRKPRSGCR